MQWDQSVGISGLRTSMTLENNRQADVSELGSDIILEDKLNADSEIINLGSGMTLKENVRTDASNLACEEKMINDSERNNAARDAHKGILGMEMSQQADASELSDVLPPSENLNDNPELRKDDVREDARGCDVSELLSPMKDQNGDANVDTNVPRNVTEMTDASQALPPKKVEDGDASMGIHIGRVETEESDASRKLYPAKGEHGDASETFSCMQDRNDDAEIKTNKSTHDGGLQLNSPPVLSKCSFAVDGTLSASENKEGQRESKRLAELRDRKRSKYLSPPYVNSSKGLKGSDQENSAAPGDKESSEVHGSSTPAPKSGSKRKKRKLSIKPAVSTANLQEISASSGELLSQLHLAALDCLYPSGKKHFDPTEIFFTIFRSSVFHGNSNTEVDKKDKRVQHVRDEKELVDAKSKENAIHTEIKPEPKKRKKKEKQSNGSATPNALPASLDDGNVKVPPNNLNIAPATPFKVNYTPVGVPVTEVPKPTTTNSLDFSLKDKHTDSPTVDISQDSKKTIFLSFENKEAVSMPHLNGNFMTSNGLAAGSQSEGPFFLTGMPGPKKRGRKKGTVVPKTNPDGNPEKKKRRRKRKDGTYADELPNATPILSTSMPNSKPISLEACLRNGVLTPSTPTGSSTTIPPALRFPLNPTPPSPMGPSNTIPPAPRCPSNTTPAAPRCPSNTTSPAPRFPSNTNLSPGGARPGEAPSLDQMKKSLEMMTSMLKQSGDNLLPEMKGMLENEIQGLLKKVSTMSSSSSS